MYRVGLFELETTDFVTKYEYTIFTITLMLFDLNIDLMSKLCIVFKKDGSIFENIINYHNISFYLDIVIIGYYNVHTYWAIF